MYHFRCFPIPFLLLYLSFHLDSVITTLVSAIFRISNQIPDQDVQKIATLVQTEAPSEISPKKIALKCLKPTICEVQAIVVSGWGAT